ncbi:MAG: hypothetical protein TQ37_00810, partial [Candidatus Synechococcus spongiarum 15L]
HTGSMQLGFVSAILPEYSVKDIFYWASQFSYDCVELMCWPQGKATRRYAGVTHVDVQSMNSAKARALRELAADHGCSISALGYYPNPLCPDTEYSGNMALTIANLRKELDATIESYLEIYNEDPKPLYGLNPQINPRIHQDLLYAD